MSFYAMIITSLLLFVSHLIYAGQIRFEEPQEIPLPKDPTTQKETKFLNFQNFLPFIQINVPQSVCVAKNGQNGTCFSPQTCVSRGGTASGQCYGRWGVCCVLEQKCGSVIKTNNTFLVNNEYPSTTNIIANCQYIIDKMNDGICQLRLDFEALTLAAPNPLTSKCEVDTFTVVGTAGGNPQVICGANTGQHMYIDMPSSQGSARINIATTTTTSVRQWKIKVAQIPCNSHYEAPQNCLQYYTQNSGIINSFNYQMIEGSHHIAGFSYTICIKTSEGFCGITYQANDFSVTGNSTMEVESVSGETNCTTDFLSIFTQDKTGQVGPNRYCGTAFNETTTFSKPFQIRVITDDNEPQTDVQNKGFSLKYIQIPC